MAAFVRVRVVVTAFVAIAALWIVPAALADGTTPAGWRLTPAGQEITDPVVTAGLAGPWGEAITPDGRASS